ncbi:hypothetical protein MN116_001872 [Schistosoma mekongi]|uniref:Uncharacterized protein n=1 Tax=Schistosoma mekongi TaxID=38744 RepID=A0AAE1ZJB8_SCHME|nr:hypothetical protein MN116_001872 [Schistosoma mekongi]
MNSSERKSKSNTNISNSNSSKGVKVIHDNPKLIAFDLRKLPNSCIEKLTALIKEDEEIFRKHNSTIFPSTSNLVNENVWDNRRYVYPEDTDHNSCFHDVDKHREYSDHRDSSESSLSNLLPSHHLRRQRDHPSKTTTPEESFLGTAVISLQMGKNQFASEKGINFGNQRHFADIKRDDLLRAVRSVINLQMGTNQFAS